MKVKFVVKIGKCGCESEETIDVPNDATMSDLNDQLDRFIENNVDSYWEKIP